MSRRKSCKRCQALGDSVRASNHGADPIPDLMKLEFTTRGSSLETHAHEVRSVSIPLHARPVMDDDANDARSAADARGVGFSELLTSESTSLASPERLRDDPVSDKPKQKLSLLLAFNATLVAATGGTTFMASDRPKQSSTTLIIKPSS